MKFTTTCLCLFSFSENLLLDFGSDVPIGENRKCYVYIKNNSAITAPFSIHIEHFYAKPPTPPDGRPDAYMPSKRQVLSSSNIFRTFKHIREMCSNIQNYALFQSKKNSSRKDTELSKSTE